MMLNLSPPLVMTEIAAPAAIAAISPRSNPDAPGEQWVKILVWTYKAVVAEKQRPDLTRNPSTPQMSSRSTS
jgi:hypothetical protein